MRKLTDQDLKNIVGSVIEGYCVERVRIKEGPFDDSDCYGFILGRNSRDEYVTWQFHLLEDGSVSAYWGHYYMENKDAAVDDFNTRDKDFTPKRFKVTIIETLKMDVEVEAENQEQAEQMVADGWKNGEYVLDAGSFTGVEWTCVECAKAVSSGQVPKENAEKPLTADDVQNLVLTGREYIAGSRTTVYDFECDIRGEHDTLQYTLEYHDDGEGFTIHTEKDDIWGRMSERELSRLEGILSREAVYFRYCDEIAGAESLEELKEIGYGIMEDESPYFATVSERVWKAFSEKERELSALEQVKGIF